MELLSPLHSADDLDAAVEYCYAQRWTDGLPVVPATRAPVERMLAYLGRDPQEVVGIIPPRNGIATIEKIVINCVMAGCRPEYVPVVIAAVKAMLEERFNLNGVQTTTHNCAPLVVVSGPAVKALGFNTKEGALGHGSRADAAIGRAVRLVLWNIGGGYPGEPCKTTHGHPGYHSFCVAEDQDANPWEPLHVERGYAPEESVVTVTATEAPHSVGTGSGDRPAEDVLMILADSIAVLGSCVAQGGGNVVVVLGPMTAGNLAASGRSKMEVKQEIARLAKRKVRDMKRRRVSFPPSHPLHWSHLTNAEDDNALVPFIREPDDLLIFTTGGWGSPGGISSICPGWGGFGGFTVSQAIEWPHPTAGP